MLVLSRKISESIVIGDNIIVRVADIRGDTVRIAIEAPRSIKIYRGEVYDAISEANKASMGLPQNDFDLPAPK
ncbi:MAG: carbon storage regulator CsrA [Acidaminococcales bacterium]|jgi:carbon storage regulator|nr:carbon storage regulator CsrA [Acidaminococcales bacterium]